MLLQNKVYCQYVYIKRINSVVVYISSGLLGSLMEFGQEKDGFMFLKEIVVTLMLSSILSHQVIFLFFRRSMWSHRSQKIPNFMKKLLIFLLIRNFPYALQIP